VIGELVYDFLVALDEPGKSMALQAVWLVALLAVLPIAVRAGGIVGVAVGHAAVAVGVVLPSYAIVLRATGVSLRDLAAAVIRPLAGVALGGAAAASVVLLISDRALQLGAGALVVAVAYLAVVYPMRAMVRSPLTIGREAPA
jgi:PST family polysaccharide transporter